jgi:hypothetical protein
MLLLVFKLLTGFSFASTMKKEEVPAKDQEHLYRFKIVAGLCPEDCKQSALYTSS